MRKATKEELAEGEKQMRKAQKRLEKQRASASADLPLPSVSGEGSNGPTTVSAPQIMDSQENLQENQLSLGAGSSEVQPVLEHATATPKALSPAAPVEQSPAVSKAAPGSGTSAVVMTPAATPISEQPPRSEVKTPLRPNSNQGTPQEPSREASFQGSLFTDEQYAKLEEIQSRAPWLYETAVRPDLRAIPDVPRPTFLDKDDEAWREEVVRRDKQLREAQIFYSRIQQDNLEYQRNIERLLEENQNLRSRMSDLEERQRLSGSSFSTPEDVSLKDKKFRTQVEEVKREGSPKEDAPRPPQEAAPLSTRQADLSQEAAREVQAAPPPMTRFQDPPDGGGGGDPDESDSSEEDDESSEERSKSRRPRSRSRKSSKEKSFAKKSMDFMTMMVRAMEKMQDNIKDKEEGGMVKGVEMVRSGLTELPVLQAWTPTQGPLQLGDWLLMVEPVVGDLTSTSSEWWAKTVKEAESWYQYHMSLAPLDRLQHLPEPPAALREERWTRLERRMSAMLLQAVPEVVKDELVASRRLTAFGILTHLYLTYCPGGVLERQTLLRSLEEPAEVPSLSEAPAALRRWLRWRQRATEIGASMPDATLLMKGINRMMRKVLEGHKELQFRVSLARNTLRVDVAPTQVTVTQFATHLLAEVDQAALTDKRSSAATAKPDPKIKSLDVEKGDDTFKKSKERTGREKKGECKFFLTESGRRRGKECPWSHEMKDDQRRCYVCGSPSHMANACTRPKAVKDPSPKAKASKAEVEDSSSPMPQSKKVQEKEESEEGSASVKELLEEANRVLKSFSASTSISAPSPASKEEDEKRDVMERLHQQLKALRTFQIRKLSTDNLMGLIDSGATHALRPQRPDENTDLYPEVVVSLANGNSARLKMSPGGTMLSKDPSTEPILPMGSITEALGCEVVWKENYIAVHHPIRGSLPVQMIGGCPHLPRALTLQLISELEEVKKGISTKELTYQEEVAWMTKLCDTHPAFRDLPEGVKKRLVVQPGSWNDLPGTRRMRKKWRRDGLMVHLYAGPDSGFTLAHAWRQLGGEVDKLLEIDIQRSGSHDMLADRGIYGGLLTCAIQGKLLALLGGPNCRTRSVLRHREVPNDPSAPRPIRAWGGEEFGVKDATEEEKMILEEDDILMWRMLFLLVVATHAGEKGSSTPRGSRVPARTAFIPKGL